MGHFVCDFTLQNERMAIEKVKGKDITLNWKWWLISHSCTHGLAVTLITSNVFLGLMEIILHWIIDWLKGKNYYSLTIDQILHITCKLTWTIILCS
tara:strand:+ start:245 stop:532 length:288 start_codon:yes stop_codon:yes gene_type:complete